MDNQKIETIYVDCRNNMKEVVEKEVDFKKEPIEERDIINSEYTINNLIVPSILELNKKLALLSIKNNLK